MTSSKLKTISRITKEFVEVFMNPEYSFFFSYQNNRKLPKEYLETWQTVNAAFKQRIL